MVCRLNVIFRLLIYTESLLYPYSSHTKPVRRLNIIVYSVTYHKSIFGQTICTF